MTTDLKRRHRLGVFLFLSLLLVLLGCGSGAEESVPAEIPNVPTPDDLPQALLLSLAVLDLDEDGKPLTMPARLLILERKGGEWLPRVIEDSDSDVFHKAMAYGDEGILTFGGRKAMVKLWRPDGTTEVLWEADFGGKNSRMREGEIADVYGDGANAIAVATHDQGVVSVIRPQEDGYSVEQIDQQTDIFVHEIEVGDLNGDGAIEIYATPSEFNKLDGSDQAGAVTRYVPAQGEGRTVVADLGGRHAKEILVDDVDGDGRDELYVAVEAVSGGQVEIRRYDADTDPADENIIATVDDKLMRFLTAGDVDGDGKKEMVAAASKAGLWLLRPADDPSGPWDSELIDADSGGFEHASILLDLDSDGRDELYVASDQHDEVSRYIYTPQGWDKQLLILNLDNLSRFTFNINAAPVELLPPSPAEEGAEEGA
ncbi:MAG: VCBS repeat-containing protein [Acidobacteriota bacterium]